jgi:hypothetical protein
MADGDGVEFARGQVRDLEVQVTAFTGLGQALKEVDGVLGQVSEELARTGVPLRTRWTGSREVHAVALA